MSRFMFSAVAAGLIGGMAFATAPASATTLSAAAAAMSGSSAQVEKIQHYRGGYGYGRPYRRGYDHRYGSPYHGRYHRPGVGFGITLPGVTLGLGAGVSSAHVQWCSQRYRTYDPATDTYIPRVGERARCNSPYN